jgi:hypothetical protein
MRTKKNNGGIEMKKRMFIQSEKDGSFIYYNKRMVAREIAKMPYYQVHYNQKQIIDNLERGEIPTQHISRAIDSINR